MRQSSAEQQQCQPTPSNKGLQIKKWTDFQAHNSRSIAARVKRPSPADS